MGSLHVDLERSAAGVAIIEQSATKGKSSVTITQQELESRVSDAALRGPVDPADVRTRDFPFDRIYTYVRVKY